MDELKSQAKLVLALFGAATLANLFSKYAKLFWLEQVSKPLLMPLLMIFFFVQIDNKKNPTFRLTLAALFCAWVGDAALLYDKTNSLFFLAGLSAFLVAHLIYIFIFRSSVVSPSGRTWSQIGLDAFPFVASGAILYGYLYTWLSFEMKIAVFVYAAVIVLMVYMALQRTGQVSSQSAKWVYYGAFFFIISDGCLALDTFVYGINIPYAGVVVMLTYLIAQFSIVRGLILEIEERS
ncbi:lysoplasmalogenase [Hugenholtzia roseola]|uniref:lysoplasmalogenase n=1 Tax=Hugenholtzia roseola TaxID=1002 RepID=UPI00047C5E8C|nr:lysoplasmalogenase [Hugenholtzia roseola]